MARPSRHTRVTRVRGVTTVVVVSQALALPAGATKLWKVDSEAFRLCDQWLLVDNTW